MSYATRIQRLDQQALFDIRGPKEKIVRQFGSLLPAFPKIPNTRTKSATGELCWVGRSLWLLLVPVCDERKFEAAFYPKGLPADVSIALVSDAFVFFELSGSGVMQVMSIATCLDFESMPPNGTSFAQAFGLKTLILKRKTGYELVVDRSYGTMMEDCLRRAVGK